MIVSVTKIELRSYSKLIAFFRFNAQIIKELESTPCQKHQVTGSWNLKVWYTMTLWENEKELTDFYRQGTHLMAMKASKAFSSAIQSRRVAGDALLGWKEAKALFSS